ncbi:MAG: putative hydrolase of HD superfamily [Alteromonas macleodii]|jgi:putative hydrolase of HD superfamily
MSINPTTDRITAQLTFLVETDKLKSIVRANKLTNGSRFENVAEHSWHVCLWALVFADQSGGANISHVIQMLLLHDIVKIDAGDNPIHIPHNDGKIAAKEAAAALRIFGLLPADQDVAYRQVWEEFKAGKTAEAQYANMVDKAEALFLELYNPAQTKNEHEVLREAIETGRFANLSDNWPDLYQHASSILNNRSLDPMEPLASRLQFVMEVDQLKSVLRGTTLCDGSRHENSGEHSWHIMLWAMTLIEHAANPARLDDVLLMLLLHDIVEIDAGDNPIHGNFDAAVVEAQEQAAASRLFGMLSNDQEITFRAIWDTFEATATSEAKFAKAVDRAQPLMCNLQSGGGSWKDYNVTHSQINSRVGVKIKLGTPTLWAALAPQVDAWFASKR